MAARERARRLVADAARRVSAKEHVLADQATQRLLFAAYGRGELDLASAGVRVYSSADEDGILLALFARIGMGGRRCAEIAFGVPWGANTTNLLCNWGWTGLLVEGDPDLHDESRRFFGQHLDTRVHPPTLVRDWVTAENVNELFDRHDMTGEIDLLSIDLDGVDYWIWNGLTAVRPRVVVVEFQDFFGPDRAVTVPYDPAFVRASDGPHRDFFGASLAAFVKLGRSKGYRLVAANRYGFNAFFVADGLADDTLPEVSPASCLTHPKVALGMRERLPVVADLEWQDV